MDLKQAYGPLRKEKLSLQNEVRKLNKTIDQISSGSYEDPLKIKHLRQIRDLTWKNRSLQEEAERYHTLYSQQLEENARLRLENKGLLDLNSKLQWLCITSPPPLLGRHRHLCQYRQSLLQVLR